MKKCDKTKYRTKQDAERHIKIIREKSKRKNIPLRAYFCDTCNAWNITSKPDFKEIADRKKELDNKIEELLTNLNSIYDIQPPLQIPKDADRQDHILKYLFEMLKNKMAEARFLKSKLNEVEIRLNALTRPH